MSSFCGNQSSRLKYMLYLRQRGKKFSIIKLTFNVSVAFEDFLRKLVRHRASSRDRKSREAIVEVKKAIARISSKFRWLTDWTNLPKSSIWEIYMMLKMVNKENIYFFREFNFWSGQSRTTKDDGDRWRAKNMIKNIAIIFRSIRSRFYAAPADDHRSPGIGLADDDDRQRVKEMNRFLIFFIALMSYFKFLAIFTHFEFLSITIPRIIP